MINIIRSPRTYTEDRQESVLDVAQPQLNPAIWDADEKLRPEVREELLKPIEDMKIPGVQRVAFVGSNTGYQYTPESDIDVHLWIPDVSEDQIEKFKEILPQDLLLSGTHHPLQYYVVADDETQGFVGKGAMYDLEKDEWIVRPRKSDIEVPLSHIFEIAKFFFSGIDNRIMELEADEKELQHFELISAASGGEDARGRIEALRTKIRGDFDAIETAAEVLYGYRSNAYQGQKFDLDAQMGEGNESVQNAVYKVIEELGYKEKIKTALARRPQKETNNG